MNRLVYIVLAAVVFPAPPKVCAFSSFTHDPITSREALQAAQAWDETPIQRQHEQVEGLTRQMQYLKVQFDTLQHGLGEDAAATDQAGGRVNQAGKQKYGVRVRR